MRPLRTSVTLAALVFLGCASLAPQLPVPVPKSPAPEQTQCEVAARQDTPLVTEWPASEKANLEVLLRRGGVAVAYSGCQMRVLPGCNLRGAYGWQRTSPMLDAFEVNDEGSLYAKLPLGAASLEGELKLAGKLSIRTHVAGQLRLGGLEPGDIPFEGECLDATHVIGGLSVGAFSITRGGSTTLGAGGGIQVVSAGGSITHGTEAIRAAGDVQTCGMATDEAPHPNCRSPIQVFLWTIPDRAGVVGRAPMGQAPMGQAPMGQPPMGQAPMGQAPPPGLVRVDLFSGDPEARWDVYIDDRVACTTPCTQWVSPYRPIFMRTREDGRFGRPDKVRVANLGPYAQGGPMRLDAHPTAAGLMSTGIVFTSLGGMAVITGISLSGVGCSDRSDPDRAGMCTAGMITLGSGALVTAGAIYLILSALPRAEVSPLYRSEDGVTTLYAGPGFVAGTF